MFENITQFCFSLQDETHHNYNIEEGDNLSERRSCYKFILSNSSLHTMDCELPVAMLAAFLGLSLVGNVALCWMRRRSRREKSKSIPTIEEGLPSPVKEVMSSSRERGKPPLRSIITPSVSDNMQNYIVENERLASIVKLREREKQELWEQLHHQQPLPSLTPGHGDSLFGQAQELLRNYSSEMATLQTRIQRDSTAKELENGVRKHTKYISAELCRLEDIWQSRDDRYAAAMKELTSLRRKSDPLTDKLVSNTISTLQDREKTLHHSLTDCSNRLTAANATCSSLEADNAAIKKDLYANKQKHKTDFQQLLDELTNLQLQYGGVQVTENELANSRREAAVLRKQLQQEGEAHEDAARELERLREVEIQFFENSEKIRRLETELSTRPILTVPSPARLQQPLPSEPPTSSIRLSVLASPRKHSSTPLLSAAEQARLAKPTPRMNKRHPLLEMSPANASDGRRSPILKNPLDGWG